MKTLAAFAVLLTASGLSMAQHHGGSQGGMAPAAPGGVVHSSPAIVSPNVLPNAARAAQSSAFGQIATPFGRVEGGVANGGFRGNGFQRRSNGYIYSYPVYVPYAYPSPYYDNGYGYVGAYPSVSDQSYYAPQQPAPAQQQPNVIVVYPPQQPMMVGQPMPPEIARPQTNVYQPPATPAEEVSHFLIAFKDHTIYSAIAFWVQGDTLHYFTSGNTHNQVSLSLVDKELTERLNHEAGNEVKLGK